MLMQSRACVSLYGSVEYVVQTVQGVNQISLSMLSLARFKSVHMCWADSATSEQTKLGKGILQTECREKGGDNNNSTNTD